VIILARGGGATEDLSCFNSEIVVRAIAECSIPIVTGIGHERDESLADLVADVRAATPTAAAGIVVPDLDDLWEEHLDRVDWVRSIMQKVLLKQQNQLKQLRTRCERIRPDRRIELEADRLAGLQQRLKRAIIGRLEAAEQEQLRLKERSQALDPTLVLQRGYALVREKNGSIVRDGDNLVVGDELSIQFGIGQTKVRVIENGKK
jgi:exodeoxyribonuclease VII large subunit